MRKFGNFIIKKEVRNEMDCYVITTVSGIYEVVYPIMSEMYTFFDTALSDNIYDKYLETMLTLNYWFNNSVLDLPALEGISDVLTSWSERMGNLSETK